MKNADKPIYPIVTQHGDPKKAVSTDTLNGLTKREYFAGLAMQAIIPNWNLMKGVERGAVADIAVEMADSLLRQLENKKS
ncbi:hypothetical protein CMT57_09240 [Elizabethkingia anophelis]|nr:hypothetical protein [Elizabethkingia anophelis]